jgi:hypothetical protein
MPQSGEWLAARIRGQLVVIDLHKWPEHRVDQWAAVREGELLSDAAGLTVLCTLLRQSMGRPLSLRAYAGLQQGYTARDEADAAATLDA